MSKKPVKTDALAWSGGARRVPEGEGNRGSVEGFTIGVAEARTAAAGDPAADKPRGTSAFTERPAVEMRRIEDDTRRDIRPNGRVKLDRY